MKILMRADTHVNIELPSNAPEAKCTVSQVKLPKFDNEWKVFVWSSFTNAEEQENKYCPESNHRENPERRITA